MAIQLRYKKLNLSGAKLEVSNQFMPQLLSSPNPPRNELEKRGLAADYDLIRSTAEISFIGSHLENQYYHRPSLVAEFTRGF